MKDSHMQHKKRIAEMMASLMKDLSEVGTVMGNNSVDVKVGGDPLAVWPFL